MPGYSYQTYAQVRAQIANRLDDYSKVFWVDDEIGTYFKEALMTWQSLARYWRGRMTFSLAQGEFWYDLTAQTGTLVGYTVKDTDLNSWLAYALVEAQPSGGTWNGTQMFTLDDFTQAVQRRRDAFLVETGLVLNHSTLVILAAQDGIGFLPDTVIDIRRAAWLDSLTSLYTPLWPTDEWRAQALAPYWNSNPGSPVEWSIVAQPVVQLQLVPPPAASGEFDYISVNAGAALNPSAGVLLGIPDDFCWVVKYGALADLLLRPGESFDPVRAKYCMERWSQGIAAARAWSFPVTCYLDGVQAPIHSLTQLDSTDSGWQNAAQDTPRYGANSGWNLMAVSPPPDANPHSMMLDVVQNAPLPAADGDYIQVGREELDVIIDYAVHLAAFKQGGAEFSQSVGLWENFLQMALVRNERLAAVAKSTSPFDRSLIEHKQRPRRAPTLPRQVGP